jgi:hypothetical protein
VDAKPGSQHGRAANMVRLVALVALVLLWVSVSAGPAAQPLDGDHLEGLLGHAGGEAATASCEESITRESTTGRAPAVALLLACVY